MACLSIRILDWDCESASLICATPHSASLGGWARDSHRHHSHAHAPPRTKRMAHGTWHMATERGAPHRRQQTSHKHQCQALAFACLLASICSCALISASSSSAFRRRSCASSFLLCRLRRRKVSVAEFTDATPKCLLLPISFLSCGVTGLFEALAAAIIFSARARFARSSSSLTGGSICHRVEESVKHEYLPRFACV